MKVRNRPLGIGIIGCGAIATKVILPVIKSLGLKARFVVDKDVQRAARDAKRFGIKRVTPSLSDAPLDEIDVAIVAVPNSLHAPISIELLRRGIHVMVEKPIATTVMEAERMIEAADANDARLTVSHVLRFAAAMQWIAALIGSGCLGRVKRLDARIGNPYQWPIVSDSRWDPKISGGGTLIDSGMHLVDLLLWWFGDVDLTRYRDDADGGVEADLILDVKLPEGGVGVIELSRTRNLRNTVIIEAAKGLIEFEFSSGGLVRCEGAARSFEHDGAGGSELPIETLHDLYCKALGGFVDSCRKNQAPPLEGREALRSLRFVESCYARREHWALPWLSAPLEPIRATPKSNFGKP